MNKEPQYLPPQTTDPGIPHKWQRPSIRERGLIIWILVLTIISFFTTTNFYSGFDKNNVYDAVREALSDENGGAYGDSSGITRTPLLSFTSEVGTVVFTIATNNSFAAHSLYGVVVEGAPAGVKPEYISGPMTIQRGEAQVLALLLPEKTKLESEELEHMELTETKAPNDNSTFLGDVSFVENDDMEELIQAYEPIAREQLNTYLATKSVEK